MGAEAPQFVGCCHCCGCCCGIQNSGRLDPSIKETVQRSNYRVVKDIDKCTNCGECIRRCEATLHFSAQTWKKTEDGEVAVYNRDNCVGCGACVMGCNFDALELEPVSEEEWFHVAPSFTEWEKQRLANLAAQKE
jgi:NAD-dependent dihydropyrimidine dehydrogenase PreA subunit